MRTEKRQGSAQRLRRGVESVGLFVLLPVGGSVMAVGVASPAHAWLSGVALVLLFAVITPPPGYPLPASDHGPTLLPQAFFCSPLFTVHRARARPPPGSAARMSTVVRYD